MTGLDAAVRLADEALAELADVAARMPGARVPGPRGGFGLLGERGEVVGEERWTDRSCRLLRTADGWIAVNLARADDLDLLPAWLDLEVGLQESVWDRVADAVAGRDAIAVVEQGQLLGMAVARVPAPGEVAEGDVQLMSRRMVPPGGSHVRIVVRPPAVTPPAATAFVVDLSSLWAGPLCGRLLAELGLNVVKVESTTRPDGTRLGSPEFFGRLNGDKGHLGLPLATAAGRAELRRLVSRADIVIEGSRPRALAQMGIDPAAVVRARPGVTWVSITAYGRTGPWCQRVGFGDDAAAAGGLVDRGADGAPALVGDAIADPLAGVAAAAAVARAHADGGGVVLDVALREVARVAALRAEASTAAGAA